MSDLSTGSTADLKSRLAALLRQGNADERAFAATLPEEERERTGTVDAWAPKEYIAHLAFWRDRETERAQTLARGGEAQRYGDFQTLNTESFSDLSKNTWESAMEGSRQSTEALIAAVEALPEATLLGPARPQQPDEVASVALLELVVNDGYLHPQQHLAEMTAARGDAADAASMLRRALAAIIALDAGFAVTSNARYNIACSFARSGPRDEVLALLRQSFAENPSLIAWARNDTDLDPLRDDPAFQALVTEG
jgi:hypothetical protein